MCGPAPLHSMYADGVTLGAPNGCASPRGATASDPPVCATRTGAVTGLAEGLVSRPYQRGYRAATTVTTLFPVAQACSAPTLSECVRDCVECVRDCVDNVHLPDAGTVSHSVAAGCPHAGCDVWRGVGDAAGVVASVLPCYLGPLMAKILVIDDHLELRELFAEVLIHAGHDVITASDGYSGLALYVRHRPALVITDLEMPGLPGLAVVERLSLEPGLKIIAISGSSLDNLDRAWQLGAAVTLKKPFHLTQLLAAVRQLVGEQPPSVN